MRYQITTRDDLRNYLDSATSGWYERTDAELEELTDAVQSNEHPQWGSDWTEFLESLDLEVLAS